MKITCPTCGTPYEVDDSQIPPGGATMKCTQCHSPIQVRPMGATAPPKAGPSRYYLRRRTGKVFGPFVVQAISSMLEQGKLEGSEQVSPDGQSWISMSQVPELAQYAADGGDDVADLPAPKRDVPDLPGFAPQPPQPPPPQPPQQPPMEQPWQAPPSDVADLPAPKGAITPPPSPAGGGGGFDLGDFDRAPAGSGFDPGDVADLPAPKGPAASPFPGFPAGGQTAPPAPPSAPPAPPGFTTGSSYDDLPAPKGPSEAPFPGFSSGSGYEPPSAPQPPPAAPTGMDYGQLDLGGDEGVTGLPAPKDQGLADLPAPKRGVAPPPPGFSPAGAGLADLPAPKDGLADLPAPKDGLADLPGPKSGMDYGSLDLGDGGPGVDDLPMPAGGSDALELDSGFDLPAPKEDDSLEPDFEAPDLVEPKPPGQPDFVDGFVDVVAPKPDEGGGDQPLTSFAPPSGAPAAVEMPVMPLDEGDEIRRPSLLKRKLIMGGIAGGAFLLVVGLALGLLTPFGFFGIGLLTGEYSDRAKGEDLVKSAVQAMRLDTSQGYDQAATDLTQATEKLSDEIRPRSLHLQAIAASMVRFGPSGKRATGRNLATTLRGVEEPSLEVEASLALWILANGAMDRAVPLLDKLSGKEPGNAVLAVFLGWGQMAQKKHEKAKATFARALSAEPDNPAALFGAAQAEVALGQTKAAMPLLDRTIKASPKHPGALLLKASLLLAAGNRKEAAKDLKVASSARDLASRPELSMLHTRLGDLARLEGKANEARQQYLKALKLEATNHEAQTGLGQLYFSSRRINDALEHFIKASTEAPTDLAAAVGVARCHILLGEPLKAQKVLQKLRKHHPEAAEIPFLLGRVETSVDNLTAAVKNFRVAISRAPTYFEPYQHLSQVYVKQNKVQQALDLLAKANKHMPGSPLVRDAEGMVHLATGDLKTAAVKFKEALRLDPTFNMAKFHVGVTQMAQEDLEGAKKSFLAVYEKDANFSGLAEKMGELYVKLESYKEAAQAYDRALEEDNPSIETRLGAAHAYNLAGEYEKALDQTAEVLKLRPTESWARARRAEARMGQGKLDDALVEIRQAVDRDKRPTFLIILGRIHAARREFADAIDAYRDALKLDPAQLEVRFERAKLLVKGGAVRDAIKELNKVLKVRPGLAEAHLYMGMALADSQKEARAIASFRVASARDPKLGEAHYRLGQLLFDTRNLGGALSALSKATKLAKEDDSWRPNAFYLLGTTARLQGQKKLAVEALSTYWKIAPPGASATRRDAMKQLRGLGVRFKKSED